jgi:RNA polymerase sigma-70 factor (ECF subfamily)
MKSLWLIVLMLAASTAQVARTQVCRRKQMPMQFCSFDGSYLERLCSGDVRTQQHFVAYFSELIRLKLGKRLRSPSAIEDGRQETFTRVWVAVRNRGIRQPESFGAFVNSVCNNALREHYRRTSKDVPSRDEVATSVTDPAIGVVDVIANGEIRQGIRQILDQLSERDCLLLEQLFLEERDKNQVCQDLGVSRQYLRVLLHRAKKSFRALSVGSDGARTRTSFAVPRLIADGQPWKWHAAKQRRQTSSVQARPHRKGSFTAWRN